MTKYNNHFIISYAGNKRSEFSEIKKKILLTNIKYIVEPFAGTSAFSYFLSLEYPKEFTYILNDNNKHLMELYLVMKDEDKLKDFEKEFNLFVSNDLTKEKYLKRLLTDDMFSFVLKNKIFKIRPGLFPLNYKPKEHNFNNIPIINFLRTEKVEFYNIDAIEIIKKYNKPDCFIFLDPPYIFSCNDNYSDVGDINVYEYLHNNKITLFNSKIMMCINSMWISEMLFKDNIKSRYSKNYSGHHKKNAEHIIITNY